MSVQSINTRSTQLAQSTPSVEQTGTSINAACKTLADANAMALTTKSRMSTSLPTGLYSPAVLPQLAIRSVFTSHVHVTTAPVGPSDVTQDDGHQESPAVQIATEKFKKASKAADAARKEHDRAVAAFDAAEKSAINALAGAGKKAFDQADAAYDKAVETEADTDKALGAAYHELEHDKSQTALNKLDAAVQAHDKADAAMTKAWDARWKTLKDYTTPTAKEALLEASKKERETAKKLDEASEELNKAEEALDQAQDQAKSGSN